MPKKQSASMNPKPADRSKPMDGKRKSANRGMLEKEPGQRRLGRPFAGDVEEAKKKGPPLSKTKWLKPKSVTSKK